jgi:hypothetical protein
VTLDDSKDITNTYTGAIANIMGNPTSTVVVRYTDKTTHNATTMIDKVTTDNSIDTQGRITDQVIKTYARGTSVTSKRTVHNYNFDARGNAQSEEVRNYFVSTAGVETMTSYQVITSRKFDATRNVLNQKVITYDSDLATKQFLSAEEIRSTNFYSSGIAGDQTIVTYSDSAMTTVLEAKKVKNESIYSGSNIGKTTITTYQNVSIADDPLYAGTNDGVITLTGEIDQTVITTAQAEFDKYGNATIQKIVRKTNYSGGVFTDLAESRKVDNSALGSYDGYNRALESVVTTYSDEAQAVKTEVQKIHTLSANYN